jgi:hypothetical protein
MIFASRHPDAMVIFNDEMCKAFNSYTNRNEMQATLFADEPWTVWRDSSKLVDIVIEYVNRFPGKTRQALWLDIINDYFMLFTASEYKQAVNGAVEAGRITSPTQRRTRRLNDNCELRPA